MEFGAKLSLKDQMVATIQRNIAAQKQLQKQVEETRAALDKVSQAKHKINMDGSAAKKEADKVKEAVNKLKAPVQAKIEVNDQVAQQRVSAIKEKLDALKNRVVSPVVRLNDTVTPKISQIKYNIESLRNRVIAPIVTLKDRATVGINKIKSYFNAVKNMMIQPLVINARDKASAILSKVKAKATALKNMALSPVIRVKDTATRVISGVTNKMKALGHMVASPFIRMKDTASGIISNIGGKLSALGKKVASPLVKVKDMASAVLGKIGGMLKTLAKGATIAVSAVMTGSLLEGSKLEQSIGGVETLFKDSADIVKKNADAAFQTAGLSANNYMETVTAFSASLLQSLGGDTQKAAQVADMAVVDMSDNANKMGTSMEDIQNAYQGFAKQNYTMLDNLKLGYGGTKTEMERLLSDAEKLTGQKYDISNLSDVYNAVHAIQENLDIAGTTAKEAATTFSGSFNSMKAAAQNLLGNLAIVSVSWECCYLCI